MPGGDKGHTYFNKPVGKSNRSVLSTYDLFLPADIKGLNQN